jgi:hypothetical protein
VCNYEGTEILKCIDLNNLGNLRDPNLNTALDVKWGPDYEVALPISPEKARESIGQDVTVNQPIQNPDSIPTQQPDTEMGGVLSTVSRSIIGGPASQRRRLSNQSSTSHDWLVQPKSGDECRLSMDDSNGSTRSTNRNPSSCTRLKNIGVRACTNCQSYKISEHWSRFLMLEWPLSLLIAFSFHRG